MLYLKRFPQDKIIVADAYKYLEDHYNEFDFIWASPPCTSHTRLCALPNYRKRLPDLKLYSLIIFLQRFFKGKWIVENVISYYDPLIKPTIVLDRHYLWSNFHISNKIFEKKRGNWKDLPIKQLCRYLNIDFSVINSFTPKNWPNHDSKRQILRNCIFPEIGKYILDQATYQVQKNLIEFVEV